MGRSEKRFRADRRIEAALAAPVSPDYAAADNAFNGRIRGVQRAIARQ